ncbi:hypothetical protein GW915_08880 [bacterium]|nr:hypothetical protein [bacterium]
MKNLARVFTALLVALSFSSYAQLNPMYSGMGLGEQFGGGASGSFGVSCMCARSVAAGMNQDPTCDQNVKAMVDRAVSSNPGLNPLGGAGALQFQQPAHTGATPTVPNAQ